MERVVRCGGWLRCLAVTIGPKRPGYRVEIVTAEPTTIEWTIGGVSSRTLSSDVSYRFGHKMPEQCALHSPRVGIEHSRSSSIGITNEPFQVGDTQLLLSDRLAMVATPADRARRQRRILALMTTMRSPKWLLRSAHCE